MNLHKLFYLICYFNALFFDLKHRDTVDLSAFKHFSELK